MCSSTRRWDTARDDSGWPIDLCYLNNARRSPMPRGAYQALCGALASDFQGDHADSDRSIREVRRELAALLGAQPAEIALTHSASDSFNVLVNGLDWKEGDNVLITDLCYRSMALALLRLQNERGVLLRVVETTDWRTDADRIAALVDRRTRMCVVDHVPVFCGVIQPIDAIGKALEGSGVLFVVNATQSAGQVPIDVRACRCDCLFGTSRKWLRGPRGLGFLYVRGDLVTRLRPATIGYPAAEWVAASTLRHVRTIDRFRVGDQPSEMFTGFAASVAHARRTGVAAIATKNARLGTYCRERLTGIDNVMLHDGGTGTTGTIPFTVTNHSADEVVGILARERIVVCAIYAENARLAFDRIGAAALVRASFHYFNTEADADHLADIVERLGRSTGVPRP